MLAKKIQTWAAAGACLSMLISPLAVAAPQAAAANDVALQEGGLLVGQIVDAQGAPVANAPVAIRTGGKEIVRVATNQNGVYNVSGLRGGVYEVATTDTSGVYRMWAPRTAPPSARRGLMMVTGPQVVRGQYPGPTAPGPFATMMGWIAEHPLLTTAGVAAAIAIPLAINDDDPAS